MHPKILAQQLNASRVGTPGLLGTGCDSVRAPSPRATASSSAALRATSSAAPDRSHAPTTAGAPTGRRALQVHHTIHKQVHKTPHMFSLTRHQHPLQTFETPMGPKCLNCHLETGPGLASMMSWSRILTPG